MKHGKKYVDSAKAVDSAKFYESAEALELVCQNAKAKFDETVEAHIRLGVDSRHADQQVEVLLYFLTVLVRQLEYAYSVRKTSTRLLRLLALTSLAVWISLTRS